jgi:hypothetical protein
MDALAQAQRTSNTMELTYRMELPPELADLAAHGPAEGLVEVPATADVPMLKRFFMYGSHNKLKPPLQVGTAHGVAGVAQRGGPPQCRSGGAGCRGLLQLIQTTGEHNMTAVCPGTLLSLAANILVQMLWHTLHVACCCNTPPRTVPASMLCAVQYPQELVTAGGEVMVDYKEDGRTVMPLSRYGITSGSVITLRVVVSG